LKPSLLLGAQKTRTLSFTWRNECDDEKEEEEEKTLKKRETTNYYTAVLKYITRITTIRTTLEL
jgi:hypothetical protein